MRGTAPAPGALVRLIGAGLIAAIVLSGAACGLGGASGGDAAHADLRIVSGSENEALEPIIQRFADDEGVDIAIDYLGSVDIMLGLEQDDAGAFPYDAVWPANSLWSQLGDRHGRVRDEASIMRSPVVFGVKRSVVERLGWVDADVTVADILAVAEAGELRFAMTSATQSNSGASAYLGFLSAFAGAPEVLRSEDLQRPEVTDRVTRLLRSVERSSGSSGWLKDLLLRDHDRFDAMVNYEALVIEANRELARRGDEPLYAVYPVDGLAIADSPLGYVERDNADPARLELFQRLQEHLLAPAVQQEILRLGRRVGAVGLGVDHVDTQVFNPEWGIDVERPITPIRMPDAAVIREALDLYQTAFRKPSFTVFCLDYSGSMEGDGQEQLIAAMRTLLDPDESRRHLLQLSPNDITVVIPFDEQPHAPLAVLGNGDAELAELISRIETTPLGPATNIYDSVAEAFRTIERDGVEGRFPAVILMTDGRSNVGTFDRLRDQLDQIGLDDVPVYAILFGSASEAEVTDITELTGGRVFDGRDDLIEAFRTAKGYN